MKHKLLFPHLLVLVACLSSALGAGAYDFEADGEIDVWDLSTLIDYLIKGTAD